VSSFNGRLVTKEDLLKSTINHKKDVKSGLLWVIRSLLERIKLHDYTKIDYMDEFHKDFISGFRRRKWLPFHYKTERHHLNSEEGIKEDVDLIDVIECLVDGVVAGKARNDGLYRYYKLPDGVLERAYENTIKKLLRDIEVKEEE